LRGLEATLPIPPARAEPGGYKLWPTRRIQRFMDDVSNWHLRRSRRRFWKAESDEDSDAAYQTLDRCLITLAGVLAPFMPHSSEAMYRSLIPDSSGNHESVHLTPRQENDPADEDERLRQNMRRVLDVARLGRGARLMAGIRIRQPWRELLVQDKANGTAELVEFEDRHLYHA
jgi:isoleucyl-tRNA synthetase